MYFMGLITCAGAGFMTTLVAVVVTLARSKGQSAKAFIVPAAVIGVYRLAPQPKPFLTFLKTGTSSFALQYSFGSHHLQ